MSLKRWDIFCRVIDNYGDIGVCYRLARQLSDEYGLCVRLWVDVLEALASMAPSLEVTQSTQNLEGVEVRHWTAHAAEGVEVADVVIEAFACDAPEAYVAAMANSNPAPCWINLEYLSAENWVEGCHGLPSTHPKWGLVKHFFFPGFTSKTGGLLKEASLDIARQAFVSGPSLQQAFWLGCNVPAPLPGELKISLFAYENPALASLLDHWVQGDTPIYLAIPTGKVLTTFSAWAGKPIRAGDFLQYGALRVAVLPFLKQSDYDCLLWACDVNFVRGEDSIVRAQWAQKPFFWHIYPQAACAHEVKLEAFLARYTQGLSPSSANVVRNFWRSWNGLETTLNVAECWFALQDILPLLSTHSPSWSKKITEHGSLAANLVFFCSTVIE